MKKTLPIIVLAWFFMANSYAGFPGGGGRPKEQKTFFYGPFKDKATCEDIRRQVSAISPCWEA